MPVSLKTSCKREHTGAIPNCTFYIGLQKRIEAASGLPAASFVRIALPALPSASAALLGTELATTC
jgi:hypothetical protein